MAIVFTTGTISQPDAGSVGTAMADKIRDDLVAHVAWELVEEYTAPSGTVKWYVFKCLAAESALPNDFFLVMGRTLSTGELRMALCEGYVVGTHTMSGFAQGGGGQVVFDSNGACSATFILSTVPLSGGTNIPSYQFWTPSGTSTKWWLCVAEDGFTVAFNGASNAFIHGGVYIPLTPLTITMPLQMIGFNDQYGQITRNPAVAGANLGAIYPHRINGGGASLGSYGPVLGFRGDLKWNDKLQGNQRPVAEQGIEIASWPGQTDWIQLIGWAVGKQKRMRLAASSVPAGVAFGDAYSLQGRLWVPWLPTDSRIFDTGVPSS